MLENHRQSERFGSHVGTSISLDSAISRSFEVGGGETCLMMNREFATNFCLLKGVPVGMRNVLLSWKGYKFLCLNKKFNQI